MLVEIRDGERAIALTALGILDKRLEKARTDLEDLNIDSTLVQRAQEKCTSAQGIFEELEAANGDIEIPVIEAYGTRLALRLYRAKLADLQKDETKLKVLSLDTEARIVAIDDLTARLGGQTTLDLEAR